jgi:hypothetical protein
VFEIQPEETEEIIIDKANDIESKYSLPILSIYIEQQNNITITVKTEADAQKLKNLWNK